MADAMFLRAAMSQIKKSTPDTELRNRTLDSYLSEHPSKDHTETVTWRTPDCSASWPLNALLITQRPPGHSTPFYIPIFPAHSAPSWSVVTLLATRCRIDFSVPSWPLGALMVTRMPRKKTVFNFFKVFVALPMLFGLKNNVVTFVFS